MTDSVRPKYPEIEVQLTGDDGNAFYVVGKVRKALLRGGVEKEEVELFVNEATSGGYDHLLATCSRWVEVY